MSKYSNNSNVNLSIAVWLASDEYDHNPDPNVISVSTLIKPVRQIILGSRVNVDNAAKPDLVSRLKSRMGTAIHDAIERNWLNTNNVKVAMTDLGYPKRAIDSIVVNPNPDEVVAGQFPVYLEQRVEKSIAGMTVSGKFDAVFNGQLEDNKSTSCYSYLRGNKIADYKLQGSMYRWLNPKIITEDSIKINYIFTDWSAGNAYQDGYPSSAVLTEEYELMTVQQTEQWVRNKVNLIKSLWDAPESELPFCEDKDLFRDPPTYKYYAKSKAEQSRATKNFDNKLEAYNFFLEKGSKGEIVEVPSKVRGCLWCSSFELCSQKNQYIIDGSLEI